MTNLEYNYYKDRLTKTMFKLNKIELQISLDELNHSLDNTKRKFKKYGLHLIRRYLVRKGIKKSNKEVLKIMQKCLRNELERRK